MWYLVISRETGREESRKRNHEEHAKWLLEQHRAGHVLFSGPTVDRATGIYILLTSGYAEAERIASGDPHHLHGDRQMEILEWEPRRGFRLDGPTVEEIETMAQGTRKNLTA